MTVRVPSPVGPVYMFGPPGARTTELPAAAAAPPLVETSTQLPKPAVVLKATRQEAPSEPPVQVVPAGKEAVTVSVSTLVGACGFRQIRYRTSEQEHNQDSQRCHS